jgi:hypothetical protein
LAPLAAAVDARDAALAFFVFMRDTVDLLEMISSQTLPVTRNLNPVRAPREARPAHHNACTVEVYGEM